jgi:hypothetical protein
MLEERGLVIHAQGLNIYLDYSAEGIINGTLHFVIEPRR